MPMTQKGYILQRGANCPECGSEHLEADGFQFDPALVPDICRTYARRPVACNDCGASWFELFRLEGYEELEGRGQQPAAE